MGELMEASNRQDGLLKIAPGLFGYDREIVSGWHGEAVALFGLHGPVKPKRFEAVLAGYVPGTDLRLGRLREGEHQHRPGVNVTFSAPKSVSLEALVYAPGRNGETGQPETPPLHSVEAGHVLGVNAQTAFQRPRCPIHLRNALGGYLRLPAVFLVIIYLTK